MLTIMLLFHALALSVRAISFFPELQSLGVAMLVIIFYCMISGDTFFSMPIFFVIYQLLHVSLKNVEKKRSIRVRKMSAIICSQCVMDETDPDISFDEMVRATIAPDLLVNQAIDFPNVRLKNHWIRLY